MFTEYNNQYPSDMIDIIYQYKEFMSGKRKDYPNEDAFECLVDFFDNNRNYTKAFEVLKIALELYPYSSELMLKKADILISNEKTKEALECLFMIKSLGYSDWHVDALVAECYIIQNNLDEVENLIQQSILGLSEDDQINFYYELLEIYDENGLYDKVLDTFFKILTIQSGEQEALYKVFFWIQMTKRYEDSLAFFHSIMEKEIFNPLVWFNCGAIYHELKLYEKACEAYEYSIILDEKLDFVYYNIANVYSKLKNYNTAIEYLKRHIELNPNKDIELLKELASLYVKVKKFNQARHLYKRIMQFNKLDAQIFFYIATTYKKEKKYSLGIEYLRQAITTKPKIQYYRELTHLYFLDENYKKGFECLAVVFNHDKCKSSYLYFFTKKILKTNMYNEGISLLSNVKNKDNNLQQIILLIQSLLYFLSLQKEKSFLFIRMIDRKHLIGNNDFIRFVNLDAHFKGFYKHTINKE